MVHTSRNFNNHSYEELHASGMFSTEANCSQYLLGKKILPTKRRCNLCADSPRMTILPCPTSSYKDGCCWQCPKGHRKSLKVDSVLENSNISYKEFISLLASFAEGFTVSRAAESQCWRNNHQTILWNSTCADDRRYPDKPEDWWTLYNCRS